MSGSFNNPLARRNPGVVQSARMIKQWVKALLNLGESAVVSVNELACHLPGCPPKETVIIVMQEEGHVQVSIHKALTEVQEDDVARAFEQPSQS
ncbi:hypothetical protein ACFSE1_07750 [Rhizobium helianthi]|uniref:Nitrate reductase n=1 Tax=Rhizobium helianthi TaxID=1132695 RepID=A0ABW4M2K5_9HYPH